MSIPQLRGQRCLFHPAREAVARCPECGGSYCRECVADHQGRLICAPCLQRLLRPEAVPRRKWGRGVLRLAGSVGGLLLAWMSFYELGRLFLTLPSAFHSARIWEARMEAAAERAAEQ